MVPSPSNPSNIPALTPEQMDRRLDALRADFAEAEVLYRHLNRIVIRRRETASDAPVIVKMWSRPGLRGWLRRMLGIAPHQHEWRTLVRLRNVNMSVPRPLGCCRVVPSIAGYTDALFMEDLGDCESATKYLQRLIKAGEEQKVLEFEQTMINMTEQILEAGIVDVDHGLVNMVVQASGRPVRIDFELARRMIWPRLFATPYAQMLGHVVLLHAFAVQPETERTTRFAGKLRERLRPQRPILRRVGAYVRKYLQEQRKATGLDTRVTLPWD